MSPHQHVYCAHHIFPPVHHVFLTQHLLHYNVLLARVDIISILDQFALPVLQLVEIVRVQLIVWIAHLDTNLIQVLSANVSTVLLVVACY